MNTLHNKIDKRVLKQRLAEEQIVRTTLSFYKYANIANVAFFRDHFYSGLNSLNAFGRIYVASEGINGQMSIPEDKVDALREYFKEIDFLNGIRLNIAREDNGKSFYKLIIKVKDKIVADGLDDASFDVTQKGQHLNAAEFNELTDQNDTVLVDMRNHYESEVGHFEGAITPDVETFRESLPIIADMLEENRDKHIVMYCTGGIRCEKASAYFKHKGYDKVYQLEGGIIEYARQVQEENLENKFKGKNFVFDDRLGERITPEVISKCHQCGAPSDDHTNCVNDACHILFIQCPSCKEQMLGTCSEKCKDFCQLPEDEQNRLKADMTFNGTKFGKGRYKAARANQELEP